VAQIPIRLLNQDTAGVLARVEQGESMEITNRGKPIARLVPITADPMAELITSGLVLPPTATGPVPMPTTPADTGPEGGDLISSLRDEERW
jgi:prevent-host-death family protein